MDAIKDDEGLGNDLVSGGAAIADWYGMPERRARNLMEKHELPGAFQLGRIWYLSKSRARAAIEALASATMPEVDFEPVRGTRPSAATPLSREEIAQCTLGLKSPEASPSRANKRAKAGAPSRGTKKTVVAQAYDEGWHAGHADI